MSDFTDELRVQANQHPLDADLDQFLVAADTIEQLQQRVEELERIKSEWEQVAQPAFDYVDSCGIGEIGKSKIGALIKSHEELAAHVERLEDEITAIINDSVGVSGYHMNGDIASWQEFDIGNILEQSPQTSLVEHDYRDGGAAQKAFWEGFECGAINGAVNIRNRWEEYKSVQYAKRVKYG